MNKNMICYSKYVQFFRPRFKSYIPEDEGLKAELIPTPQPGDIIAEVEDQLKAGETVFTVQELVYLCSLTGHLLINNNSDIN